ncbi:glycine-rich protein [Natrinema salaciae]|uniref:receptor protein-tyrosine kinase n=1 Tax=Natrinema salaciae TaxID=1186196 RepID=A0A1H9EZI5_9EURY|nr:glycine-rich protein [Natrinema salaciae]SEQ30408.1 Glycine rich protein [Natrinema salaciae]
MATITETYDTAGQYSIDIPEAAENIHVVLEGGGGAAAEGGDPYGGDGGRVEGDFPQAAGETLQIYVGGGGTIGDSSGGFNGGGSGHAANFARSSGGGGGASDIRIGGTTLDDRAAVAAGGGGATDDDDGEPVSGGAGGGLEGADGDTPLSSDGEGGTQTAGGTGDESDGSFGTGGDGASGSDYPGGGGGAGWYGGGGGGSTTAGGGAGGGGSSYIDDLQNATTTTGGGAAGGTGAGANGNDGSVTITFDLDPVAATNLTVNAERETKIDTSWTVNDPDVDGQRVYRDTSSGVDPSTATEIVDLGSSIQSHTDTVLDNGTQFYYAVETYITYDGTDYTALSAEATGTTVLPDVTGFELDASVQDELTAQNFDAGLNTGQYRIRWKESDASSYDGADEATIAYNIDPLEYVIAGLLDGEKYDIGIRTETTDVTGSWHTASEVTKLVAASGITFDNLTATSIDSVSWTVESDFEGAQEVWWQRGDYEYDDPKGELLGTVSSTTSSFSDLPMIHPDRDYTVTVRAVTQYVHADGSATETSPSAGLAQHAAPPRGWFAEVEHPSGSTRQLTVADGAQWQPQLNGLPRVRLPVPRDETWRSEAIEGQPLRVWYNGRRLPIDELETVTTEAGQTVLEGRGGLQLQRAIEAEYSSKAAHLAAEELIQQHTDYTANVDAPSNGVSIADELLLEADTTAEWQDLAVFGDTDPFEVTNDTLVVLETSYFTRGTKNTSDYSGTLRNDVAYIDGKALYLTSSGDFAEWPLSFNHEIPADRIGLAVRHEIPGSTDAEWSFNGQTVATLSTSGPSLAWIDLRDSFITVDHTLSQISAGETQTLKVDITGSAGYVIDSICVYDTKYYPPVGDWADEGWDAVHEDGGHLDGPPTYPPDGAQVRTTDAETPYSVVAASVTSALNDTSGSQAVAVSNDQGLTWLEATNTETLDQSFSEDGGALRARFTLGGTGSRNNASPRFGFDPQTVDSVEVRADLEDTPILVNQTFEGDLGNVLSEIAKQGNSIWEVRRDGSGYSIEWTRAGQRQAATDLDVSSYEDTRTIESKTLACEVVGGRQSVSGRRFTADASSFVDLGDTDIIAGTEYVFDPATSEGFERGQDYEIDNRDGSIKITNTGSMADGDTYAIDYDFKPRGRHEADEWDGDATLERREEIPGLTSRRGCQQAALRIIQETGGGLTEVDVQFADLDPDQSLVSAIKLDELPGGDLLEVREIDFSDGQGRALLGDGQSVDDAVNEIRSRIEAVARRS